MRGKYVPRNIVVVVWHRSDNTEFSVHWTKVRQEIDSVIMQMRTVYLFPRNVGIFLCMHSANQRRRCLSLPGHIHKIIPRSVFFCDTKFEYLIYNNCPYYCGEHKLEITFSLYGWVVMKKFIFFKFSWCCGPIYWWQWYCHEKTVFKAWYISQY